MNIADFQALRGLDTDIRPALLQQIRDLWTHGSTAIDAYARLHLGFVHIHPFWDGNGRMARLLGNLPVLRSGHLPVVIKARARKRYIDTLATYQIAVGQLGWESNPMPDPAHENAFLSFCHASYGATRALIEAARERQVARSTHYAHARP